MKHLVFFAAFLLLFGCIKNDDDIGPQVPLTTKAIVGKWQLERYYYSAGGPGEWSEVVKNGSVYIFDIDGKFTYKESEDLGRNREGVYQVEGDELVLNFEYDGDAKEYTYSVEISKQKMILTPTAPFICIEGCAEQFKKVD